jgi:geranylgeranyl reductase family protein
MLSQYDIVIIGAGPAGLSAGLKVLSAKPRPSVLIVDKIVPWEKPIACAEGVWTDQFRNALNVKPAWVRYYISTVVLHSADGSVLTHTARNAGCIIDRAKMQADMAAGCASLGAEIKLDTRVQSVGRVINGLREVRFVEGASVAARVVIDASGPVAGFGKGEKVVCKPADLEPAYFVIADTTAIASDEIHIYLGSAIAPGGYGWAFPRGKDTSNIGIVLGNAWRSKINIREKLDALLATHFPNARITHRYAGPIPCEGKPDVLAAPRLFKAGDSASTVNPFTRAGIVEAIESGALAGTYALRTLSASTEKRACAYCEEYGKKWYAAMGKKHEKLAKAKDALVRIPDADYNAAFAALSKIPPSKRSITRIIGTSLGRFPRLVLAMRHLI